MSDIVTKITADLKQAMLAGDKKLATTLRGLKSVILYEEVARGAREKGLSDEDIVSLLSKEAKKRQESADLYKKGGNEERANDELAEKVIIEQFLPEQIGDDELSAVIEEAIVASEASSIKDMGKVIGIAKEKLGSTADGARIAQAVKEKLS
jgi:uncharacterized protein